MKSIIREKEKTEYPCLKIHTATGAVVFFIDRDEGLVVKEGTTDKLGGAFATDWEEANFELFEGIVVLSND